MAEQIPNAYLTLPNPTLIGGDFNIAIDDSNDRWPPGQRSDGSSFLVQLMQRLDLKDVWRARNPNEIAYTWCNRSINFRINFWLISSSLLGKTNVKISSSSNYPRNTYWKLNSSILCHEAVKLRIKELINIYWNEAKSKGNYGYKWELLKFKIGQFIRKYDHDKAKRKEEEQVIYTIATVSSISPDNMSEQDKETFLLNQNKLDRLYQCKAKGALLNLGDVGWKENRTAYFFRLEKSQSRNKSIQQLKI